MIMFKKLTSQSHGKLYPPYLKLIFLFNHENCTKKQKIYILQIFFFFQTIILLYINIVQSVSPTPPTPHPFFNHSES